jgi:hypothetical protein
VSADNFRPSSVRFRDRNPNMVAHELCQSMSTGRPVRITLRTGAEIEARVTTMTRDEMVNIASLPEQGSNLTARLDTGQAVKLDDIRSVVVP